MLVIKTFSLNWGETRTPAELNSAEGKGRRKYYQRGAPPVIAQFANVFLGFRPPVLLVANWHPPIRN